MSDLPTKPITTQKMIDLINEALDIGNKRHLPGAHLTIDSLIILRDRLSGLQKQSDAFREAIEMAVERIGCEQHRRALETLNQSLKENPDAKTN